jgi:hypothetical protein
MMATSVAKPHRRPGKDKESATAASAASSSMFQCGSMMIHFQAHRVPFLEAKMKNE